MKLSIREKKVLYDFACPNHHNTVTRLKWLTSGLADGQKERLKPGQFTGKWRVCTRYFAVNW